MWSKIEDDELFSDWEDDTQERNMDPHRGESAIDPDLGACYSGNRHLSRSLFAVDRFKEAVRAKDARHLSDPLIDQHTADVVRSAIDDTRPWEMQETHKFCIYDKALFNTNQYFRAVMILAMGGVKKVTLDEDTLERYQRRVRLQWSGVDSVHDALMLLEGKQRPAFDMEGFVEQYPTWFESRFKM